MLARINAAILAERSIVKDQIAKDAQQDLETNQQSAVLFREMMMERSAEVAASQESAIQEVREKAAKYRMQNQVERQMNELAEQQKHEQAILKALPQAYLEAFANMDADVNGVIDFSEFQMAVGQLGLRWDEQTAFRVFKAIDVDGSGVLEEDEFSAVINSMSITMENYPDASPQEIFKMALQSIEQDKAEQEEQGVIKEKPRGNDAELDELEQLYAQRDALLSKLKASQGDAAMRL